MKTNVNFFVAFVHKHKLMFTKFTHVNSLRKTKMLLWYNELNLGMISFTNLTLDQFIDNLKFAWLCLPFVCGKNERKIYTIICSSWNFFYGNSEFVGPRLNRNVSL